MKNADSSSKYFRILEMYLRLLDGERLVKKEEVERYGVDGRSIQRDIDALRLFLRGQPINGATQDVVYDWKAKGYVLKGHKKDLAREEALALCKILLESRAFTKDRIGHMVNEIIESAVPRRDIASVQQLVNNEKQYYEELHHHDSSLPSKIWTIGEAVSGHRILHIRYERGDGAVVERTVKPLSIMFSEYYFYLIAEMVHPEAAGVPADVIQFPTVYRVDRIQAFEEGETFRVPYRSRFQSGEVRKRILYMFGGRPEHVEFTYETAGLLEHVLDRLPTARVIKKEKRPNGKTRYTIAAEVYGLRGIRMWMRSQGPQLRVTAPASLVEDIRRELRETLALYEGG